MDLHPLCTLFPRVEGGEFDAMRAFSGRRKDGLGIAHATDELLAYIEGVEATA